MGPGLPGAYCLAGGSRKGQVCFLAAACAAPAIVLSGVVAANALDADAGRRDFSRIFEEGGLRQRFGFVIMMVLAVAATAFVRTARLSGVVTDTSGGVNPGADVVERHAATGVATTAVSNSEGAFLLPGIQVGAYTVTVSLDG